MKKIEAKIIADSKNPQGDRITTYLLTFPRFILAELNTHRVFSKNSASSRAIPFEKMVKMVEEDPFIPIAFQKHHKGMQGNEYLQGEDLEDALDRWNDAKNYAIAYAKDLYNTGTTKQLCNRLLEPFMWHKVLLTGTEFKNFFELRCPSYDGFSKNGEKVSFRSKKDVRKHFEELKLDTDLIDNQSFESWQSINTSKAEIHMQALAEAMWDAYNESTPKTLQSGEWHIPFGDKIDYALDKWNFLLNTIELWGKDMSEYGIKVSTARCARLSYMTFDGEIDYEKDIQLHDSLLKSHHMSPFEHCARAMSEEEYYTFIKGKSNANWDTALVTDNTYEISAQFDHNVLGWCNNFKGFIQYRHLLGNKS